MLATRLFQQTPVLTALNNLNIDIQFQESQSLADTDLIVCLHWWISFSEITTVQQDSRITSSIPHAAAEAASQIVDRELNDSNREKFWIWQLKATLTLEYLGDILLPFRICH